MLVPLAVLVLGVAAVAAGALLDRRRRNRALRALESAPDRAIPGFEPTDAPRYVRGDKAHERSAPLSTDPVPPPAERGDEIPYGMVRPGLATHDGGLMVLSEPRVLVLAEPAASVRALLDVLAERARAPRSLVIIAPEFSDEVADLCEVNVLQQYLAVGAVAVPDDAVRTRVAEATGAAPVDEASLAAGYVPEASLGRVARWISDSDRSWWQPAADPGADGEVE